MDRDYVTSIVIDIAIPLLYTLSSRVNSELLEAV